MKVDQPDLFGFVADGRTFEPELDESRLGAQMRRVAAVMADGRWRTFREIAALTGDPDAPISARLRDFRKARHGSRTVERRRRGDPSDGLFEYRLVP